MNRREFARLLAIGGAAPFVSPNAGVGAARRSAADARLAGREILDGGARSVRHAERADDAQRRQPLSLLRAGARDDVPVDEGHGSGSVVRQPGQARRRAREHAQAARRVPPRHAGRDHHHAQHQRVEQPGVDRHRPEARRRGPADRRQSSEQPHRVAGEGEALRLHGQGRAGAEPAPRLRALRRRVHGR